MEKENDEKPQRPHKPPIHEYVTPDGRSRRAITEPYDWTFFHMLDEMYAEHKEHTTPQMVIARLKEFKALMQLPIKERMKHMHLPTVGFDEDDNPVPIVYGLTLQHPDGTQEILGPSFPDLPEDYKLDDVINFVTWLTVQDQAMDNPNAAQGGNVINHLDTLETLLVEAKTLK
jgi:hypothetical protein